MATQLKEKRSKGGDCYSKLKRFVDRLKQIEGVQYVNFNEELIIFCENNVQRDKVLERIKRVKERFDIEFEVIKPENAIILKA